MRRRRPWIWGVLLLVAAIATAVGVLAALVKQEPPFYNRTEVAAARVDDPIVASTVQTRFNDLLDSARTQPRWAATFSAEELNAFLREFEYNNELVMQRKLPDGVSDVRLVADGDKLRIGFRSGEGATSVVVSLQLRAWMIENEPNKFAVEITDFSAGVLPLNKRWATDLLSKLAREQQIEVEWFRDNGNPVAVCRIFTNQPNAQLQTLQIQDGQITIGGRNKDIR